MRVVLCCIFLFNYSTFSKVDVETECIGFHNIGNDFFCKKTVDQGNCAKSPQCEWSCCIWKQLRKTELSTCRNSSPDNKATDNCMLHCYENNCEEKNFCNKHCQQTCCSYQIISKGLKMFPIANRRIIAYCESFHDSVGIRLFCFHMLYEKTCYIRKHYCQRTCCIVEMAATGIFYDIGDNKMNFETSLAVENTTAELTRWNASLPNTTAMNNFTFGFSNTIIDENIEGTNFTHPNSVTMNSTIFTTPTEKVFSHNSSASAISNESVSGVINGVNTINASEKNIEIASSAMVHSTSLSVSTIDSGIMSYNQSIISKEGSQSLNNFTIPDTSHNESYKSINISSNNILNYTTAHSPSHEITNITQVTVNTVSTKNENESTASREYTQNGSTIQILNSTISKLSSINMSSTTEESKNISMTEENRNLDSNLNSMNYTTSYVKETLNFNMSAV